MNTFKFLAIGVIALGIPAMAAQAKDAPAYAVVNTDVGVPVFATDLPDHPYTVIGPVTAHVRKATVFSPEASQEKIYKVLWKDALKMGADAVINAHYGNSHITGLSWGSTTADGTAVKFTAGPNGAPPPAAH